MVLVQACQGGNKTTLDIVSDPLTTQKSDPNKDQHITLTRPHTVLLLATIRDGLAVRGVFTSKRLIQYSTNTVQILKVYYGFFVDTCVPRNAPDRRALHTMIN